MLHNGLSHCLSESTNNKHYSAKEHGEKIAERQENRNDEGKNVSTFEALLNIYFVR